MAEMMAEKMAVPKVVLMELHWAGSKAGLRADLLVAWMAASTDCLTAALTAAWMV